MCVGHPQVCELVDSSMAGLQSPNDVIKWKQYDTVAASVLKFSIAMVLCINV